MDCRSRRRAQKHGSVSFCADYGNQAGSPQWNRCSGHDDDPVEHVAWTAGVTYMYFRAERVLSRRAIRVAKENL